MVCWIASFDEKKNQLMPRSIKFSVAFYMFNLSVDYHWRISRIKMCKQYNIKFKINKTLKSNGCSLWNLTQKMETIRNRTCFKCQYSVCMCMRLRFSVRVEQHYDESSMNLLRFQSEQIEMHWENLILFLPNFFRTQLTWFVLNHRFFVVCWCRDL